MVDRMYAYILCACAVVVCTPAAQGADAKKDIRMPPQVRMVTQPDSPPEARKDRIKYITSESGSHPIVYTLECEGSGQGKLIFQWYQNGSLLTTGWEFLNGKRKIRMKAYTSSLVGTYQCAASNDYGKAKSDIITLKESKLSCETKDPQTVDKFEGESLIWPCGIQSIPSAGQTVKKTISGSLAPVDASIRINMDGDGSGNMYFLPVKAGDKSAADEAYVCEAYNSNRGYSAYCSPVVLNILANRNITKRKPVKVYPKDDRTITAMVGETLELRCLFDANPALSDLIEWSKGGKRLDTRWSVRNQAGAYITGSPIRHDDAGRYKCTGKNTEGTTAHEINVQVKERPTFLQDTGSDVNQPKNTNATEGDSVTFYCKTSADPKVSSSDIEWTFDGTPLTDPVQSKIQGKYELNSDKTELTINNLCKSSCPPTLGVVACRASNKYGHTYKAAYLNVLKKTIITQNPIGTSLQANTTYNMSCEVETDDSTPAVIEWRLDGTTYPVKTIEGVLWVGGDKGEKLFIHYSNEDEEKAVTGNYLCHVSNGYTAADSKVAGISKTQLPTTTTPLPPLDIAGMWWLFLLIIILLFIVLIIICCWCCHRANQKGLYDVDRKERAHGHVPEEDNKAMGYHAYQRPTAPTLSVSRRGSMDSQAPLTGHGGSQYLWGSQIMDTKPFNEDGSYVGMFATTPRRMSHRGMLDVPQDSVHSPQYADYSRTVPRSMGSTQRLPVEPVPLANPEEISLGSSQNDSRKNSRVVLEVSYDGRLPSDSVFLDGPSTLGRKNSASLLDGPQYGHLRM